MEQVHKGRFILKFQKSYKTLMVHPQKQGVSLPYFLFLFFAMVFSKPRPEDGTFGPKRSSSQHPTCPGVRRHLLNRWGILTLMKSKALGTGFVYPEQTLKYCCIYSRPARHGARTH